MLRIFLTAFCLTSLSTLSFAQVASVQSGDWNDTNTWDCACVPDFNSGSIIVSAFTTVNVPLAFTADADEVVVQGDGQLDVNGTLIIRSSGIDDLIIEVADFITTFSDGLVTVYNGGVLENRSSISSSSTNLIFQNGGEYRHNLNAGIVPDADWQSGSTCRITGITSIGPGGLAQNFHHFIWDCSLQSSGAIFLNGQLTSVNGNLSILNSNSRFISLGFTAANTGSTTVTGDLVISGKSKFYVTATGTYTLNVNGSINITADPDNASNFPLLGTATGNATCNVTSNFSFSSNRTVTLVSGAAGVFQLNIAGNFSLSTGTINMSSSSGIGTLNVADGFSFTSGSITETSSGSGSINFTKSGVQTFTGGGVFSNTINFIINNNSTLDLGTGFLGGSGTFTCNGTVRVGSTDSGGAIQNSTTNGNIRVSGSRTYGSGATIVYNGAAAQFLGTGHPSSSGVNTIINNPNGVSLAASVTIGGNLTLTSGNLNVGNNTLTLGGLVTPNSNFISVSSGSSLVINGSGAFGTFPFPAGDQTITNFTLNRPSGSVTFNRNVTITGATTLSNGNLIFNNQTLTLNGSFSLGGGALSSNASSTLTIGGSGAFGVLEFAVGGNTLNTLNFSRSSGSASIDNSLTITSALNLLNGDFTNTSGLSLANNATVTRNSTAQFLGSSITQGGGEFYNVVYTGSTLSTGVELPTTGDDNLDNLTINGGPVTLTQNIIVNGDLTLQNSSLNGNGFNITMAGAPGIWNRQSGSFNPGSGTVFIAGSISVQSLSAVPQFGNITVNNGATFTARAGSMNINGNLQVDVSSTFNHNNGTLIFNGSSVQGLAGAGKTFNNITVNKTGGNLQLTSTVNLLNTLTIQSATTVESGGSLRLLSTSDGTSGNARIASLPAGASVTGNVTVQRFIADEGRIYRYISAPVSGFTVAQLQSEFPITGSFTGSSSCSGCTSNTSMFAYDETVVGGVDNGYFQFPVSSNTESLQVGRGYAPFVRDDVIPGNVNIDWVGPVNQGSIALPVTFSNSGDASADGYNLVGNPFPSSIDWDNVSGWTKSNISNIIAVRDNGAGGTFRYWDGSSGTFANGEIATGQAFWVRATGSSPALVVNEQAKTSSTATLYRQKDDEPIDLLTISLAHNNVVDNAYLRYRSVAANGIDDYDAPKLNNASFDMYTISEDDIPMAINAVNQIACGQPLKLGIKDMPNGTFKFSTQALGFFEQFDFYLMDSFAGLTVKLSANDTYEFVTNTDPASKVEDRFSFELKASVPVKLDVLDGTLYSNYTAGNMWFRNGQLIEGEFGNTFTPESPGLYTLKVKIGTCEFGAPESYIITRAEGNGKKSIRVFPNPFKNKVKLEVDSSNPVSIRLMNSLGVEIDSRQLTEPSFSKHAEFDLSGQSNGMYILHVLKDGQMHHVKIIKTNE